MTPRGPKTPATGEKPLPTEPQTPTPIREINIVRKHRSQDLQDKASPRVETEELVRKPSRSKLSKQKSSSSLRRRRSGKSRSIKASNIDLQKQPVPEPLRGQEPRPLSTSQELYEKRTVESFHGNRTAVQTQNYEEQPVSRVEPFQSPESRKLSLSERTRSLTKRISLSDFSKGRSISRGNPTANRSTETPRRTSNGRYDGESRQRNQGEAREKTEVRHGKTNFLTNKTRSLGRRISRGDLLARKKAKAEGQPKAAESITSNSQPSSMLVKGKVDNHTAGLVKYIPGVPNHATKLKAESMELSGDSDFLKSEGATSTVHEQNINREQVLETPIAVQEKNSKSLLIAPPDSSRIGPAYPRQSNQDTHQRDNTNAAPTQPRHSQDHALTRPNTSHALPQTQSKLRKRSLDSDLFRPYSAKSQKTFPSTSDARRPSLTRKVQKAIWGSRSGNSDRAMSMPSNLKPIGEKPPRIPTPEPSVLLGQSLSEVLEKWKKEDNMVERGSPSQQTLQLPSSADRDNQRPHSARSGSYSLFPADTNRSTSPRPSRPVSSENVEVAESEPQKPNLDRPLLPERNPTFTSHPPNLALGNPPSLSKLTDRSDMPVMQASPARTPLPQDSQLHKSMILEIDTATLATRNSTRTTSTPVADTDVPSLPSSLPPSAHPGNQRSEEPKVERTEVSTPTSSALDNAELPLGKWNQTEARSLVPQGISKAKVSQDESKPYAADDNLEKVLTGSAQDAAKGNVQSIHSASKLADVPTALSENQANRDDPGASTQNQLVIEMTAKDDSIPKPGPTHLAGVVLARARPRFPDRSFQRRSFPVAGSWADAGFGRLKPVEEEADHHELLERVQSASQANVLRSEKDRNLRSAIRRRPLSASYAQGPLFSASKERVDQLMLAKPRPQSMHAAPNPAAETSKIKRRPVSSSTTIRPSNDSELKHLSDVTVIKKSSSSLNRDADGSFQPVEDVLQRLLLAHEDEHGGSRPVSNSSAAEALKTLVGEVDISAGETADEAYKRLTLDTSNDGNISKSLMLNLKEKESDEFESSKGEPNISRRRSPMKRHTMSGAVPATNAEDRTPMSAFHTPISAYPSPTTNRTHHLTSPISFPSNAMLPYRSSATQTSPASASANSYKRHSWAGTPSPSSAAATGSLLAFPTRRPGMTNKHISPSARRSQYRHSAVDPRTSTALSLDDGDNQDIRAQLSFASTIDPSNFTAIDNDVYNNEGLPLVAGALPSASSASHKPRLSLDTSRPSSTPPRPQRTALHIGPGIPWIVPPPPPPPPPPTSTKSPASKSNHARTASDRSLETAQSQSRARASSDGGKRNSKGKTKSKSKTRHIGDAAHERQSLDESRYRLEREQQQQNKKAEKERGRERERERGSWWKKIVPVVTVVTRGRGKEKEKGKEREWEGGREREVENEGREGGGLLKGGGGGDVRVFRGVGRDGRWRG